MRLDSTQTEQVQAQIERIQSVDSARLRFDAHGEVDGVDAIADTQRPAQRIVRDIEVVLRRHGVDLDHRKISIAQLEDPHSLTHSTPERDREPVAPSRIATAVDTAEPEGLDLVDEPERLRPVAVHSTTRGGSFSVEVEMVHGSFEAVPGRAEGPSADPSGCLNLVAEAALDAVRNLLEPGYEAQLRETRRLGIGGESAVLVAVDFGDGREVRRYLGSCPNRGSLYDAAVYAVLDALNRPLGRARFRRLAILEDRERGEERARALGS